MPTPANSQPQAAGETFAEKCERQAKEHAAAGNRLEAIKAIRNVTGSLALAVKWADTHCPKQNEPAGQVAHTLYYLDANGNIRDRLGRVVAVCEPGQSLAPIVRACNSHAALTEENATLTAENKELEKVVEAAGVEIDSLTTQKAALVAALEIAAERFKKLGQPYWEQDARAALASARQ